MSVSCERNVLQLNAKICFDSDVSFDEYIQTDSTSVKTVKRSEIKDDLFYYHVVFHLLVQK